MKATSSSRYSPPHHRLVISYIAMKIALSLLRRHEYHRTMARFTPRNSALGGAVALGHGIQDAQKTMGIIIMALLSAGFTARHTTSSIPSRVR